MESNTQKLIHSFGALADLGQEIADTGDFIEMVRTSLHLLLGTLAIRRGAIVECPAHLETTNCLAIWGLSETTTRSCMRSRATREAFLNSTKGAFAVDEADAVNRSGLATAFLAAHRATYRTQEIELIVPMIVRGKLTGLVAARRQGQRRAVYARRPGSDSARWCGTSASAFTRIVCSPK